MADDHSRETSTVEKTLNPQEDCFGNAILKATQQIAMKVTATRIIGMYSIAGYSNALRLELT